MRPYKLDQWVNYKKPVSGDVIRVRILDVEFETGFGPIFLLGNCKGLKFWLTRKELEEGLA